ncbi:MAG: ATP-binding protein [Lentimicrobium sp.]|nr:ATP-binding protein [Lentimicrobium sp.]
MKTQNKLLIILLITALILFAGFLTIMQIQKKQNSILVNSGIEQQNSILKTAVTAKSETIYSTLYDYTYWDDLVKYLSERNEAFAQDNIYTLFNSFNVNEVLMYDKSLQTAFEAELYDTIESIPEPISAEVFPTLYHENFIKYYMTTKRGVLEMQGATMHRSNDEARKQPPQGYFFMGRLLDSTYLSSLENLTGGKISILLTSVDSVSLNGNKITTSYPLNGFDGQPVAWLQLEKEYSIVTVFRQLTRISTWFLATLITAILIIFFFAFNSLVNKPLNIVSQALHLKGKNERLKLMSLKSEFKQIGAMIETYFEQTEKLETEIEVRKKAEAQKEKLIAELDNANRELKDFAYIVSHDLKAPLRAIGSISQWIYADYADKIDDDGKMQLDLLLNRVNRMQALIEGVLSYSRVTRVKEENELMDLNKVVHEAIEMIAPPEKFKITVDKNLPVVSFGPTRILQIFENLLSNAVKYNDKEVGEIHIRCQDLGNEWELSVSDNGPGIEEKYYDKIFQIFQTLKARDEYESTGIGLTIVKKIIESNGGRITVKSVPGEGITFNFTILK